MAKKISMFDLFYKADLQFFIRDKAEVPFVQVGRYIRRARDETLDPPVLADEHIEAIKNVLDAKELDSKEVPTTDEISGLIIHLTALRFTKKR